MPHKHRHVNRAWRRERAEQLRQDLIIALGGKCCKCGRTKKLEFNHIYERTWRTEQYTAYSRMLRYWEDYHRGWIELRCKRCNRYYIPKPLTEANQPF